MADRHILARAQALESQAIEVKPVESGRQRRDFVEFPWQIYGRDPQWVPPLLKESHAFIDRRHPFYGHGDATQFIAYYGGQVVGRIQASDDPRFNEQHDCNAGHFGLFECIDNPAVASQLLNAAADWVRRRGRDQIIGPVDYSLNYTRLG